MQAYRIGLCFLFAATAFSVAAMAQVERLPPIDDHDASSQKWGVLRIERLPPSKAPVPYPAPSSSHPPARSGVTSELLPTGPAKIVNGHASPRPQPPTAKQDPDEEAEDDAKDMPEGGETNKDDDADDEKEDDEDEDDEDEDEEEDEEEELPEPWTLFHLPLMECQGTKLRGWLAQGFTFNPARPRDRSNGLLGMNDRSNEYQFSQLGLKLDHPLADDPEPWSIGYRLDFIMGTDARYFQSLGYDDDWNFSRFVSAGMPQAYFDLHVPWCDGLNARFGRFWSPIGYEGVAALDRFFYSATNAFMLAEPSTHTGFFLSYALSEQWTVQWGLVQGWDVTVDNNDSPGVLGTLGWLSPDEETTLTHIFYYGDQTDELDDDQFTYNLIFGRQVSERWSYVTWFDLNLAHGIDESNGTFRNAQWLSWNHCLFYDINDKLSAGTRLEWFHDDDGVRIVHLETEELLGEGDLFGITYGLNYTPTRNLLIRPEIRWDAALDVRPYDDLSDSQQLTAACDVVWQF